MLILNENETCPYSFKCPYSKNCQGTNPSRDNKFTCNYVTNEGIIELGKYRNILDKTGKMEIITER